MKKAMLLASMLLNAGLSTAGVALPPSVENSSGSPKKRQHNKNAKRPSKKKKPVRVYCKHTRGW